MPAIANELRVLSIKGPWAWAIIAGIKPFENRPRRFHYRGPLAIHMSQNPDNDTRANQFIREQGFIPPTKSELEQLRGKIIGIVDLVDCLPVAECGSDPWAFGPYCLQVSNPRPIKTPIRCKGALGIWRLASQFSAIRG